MNRLTSFDILRICSYVIGFGAMTTPQIVAAILVPFGVPVPTVTHIAAILGAVVILATLISNVIKNPSAPDGTHVVLSTSDVPTVDSLTTRPALKAQNGP